MIRPLRTNAKKVADWLSAVKPDDQAKLTTGALRPYFRRGKKFYQRERERSASSDASLGSEEMLAAAQAARRVRRQHRRERREHRGVGRRRPLGQGESQQQKQGQARSLTRAPHSDSEHDPQRVLEELTRLSEEDATPYPRSSSSPQLLPSPSGPCSRSSSTTSSQGGDGPLSMSRLLRGQTRGPKYSVTPLSFRPLRDLSRSALRRIYRLPNGREERRRRFKDELRRRCGLKVWTWEELVRPGRCALADGCRVPTPNDEERLRFRYRSYSPRKMHQVICYVRTSLREYEKDVDQKFAELERVMLPGEDSEDGGAASLMVERQKLMAMRSGKSASLLKGKFVSDLSLTSGQWIRPCSNTSLSSARNVAAKAFEQRTLLYLDWEPSDESGGETKNKQFESISTRIISKKGIFVHPKLTLLEAKRRNAMLNKTFDPNAKKINANITAHELKRTCIKKHINKSREATKNPKSRSNNYPTDSSSFHIISEFTQPVNEKNKCKPHDVEVEDFSNKFASTTNTVRGQKTEVARSVQGTIRQRMSKAQSYLARSSIPTSDRFHQRQPTRLPPLDKNVAHTPSLCKYTNEGTNRNTNESSDSIREHIQALKDKFLEKERHDAGDVSIDICHTSPRVLERRTTGGWSLPPSMKPPLPPLREQRMYARAVSCIGDSPSSQKKRFLAPFGKESKSRTYHF